MSTPITPIPRRPVTVRPATANDLSFIDTLQKRHTRMVGWMPTKSLEQKIGAGEVLIAEGSEDGASRMEDSAEGSAPSSILHLLSSTRLSRTPVGYCIATDRYMKREDCGIVYQLNVVPGEQRRLIGAALLRAVFDRAAYGCRLFCCWCAQDIDANRFWESLGFVPLAFRAGSRGKGRVHIFWQRRIRAGDSTTPYWFPSQTTSGAIREDRLVFPIPPGVHWRDAMPIVLPGEEKSEVRRLTTASRRATPAPAKPRVAALSGFCFAPEAKPQAEAEKPKRERKQKVKNDPRLVAAARELRDRWLERVNADPSALPSEGKYDVSRQLTGAGTRCAAPRLLAG